MERRNVFIIIIIIQIRCSFFFFFSLPRRTNQSDKSGHEVRSMGTEHGYYRRNVTTFHEKQAKNAFSNEK